MFLKVLFIIVVSFGGLLFSWYLENDSSDYDGALEDATTFLKENEKELNELARNYLDNHNFESREFKIVKSIKYSNIESINEESLENVVFDCDAQGMLGGQYWGLMYIPSDQYLGEKDLYVYDEKEIEREGNNIFIRKRIKKNWFFYYNDWDGKVDLKQVKKFRR